MDRVLMPGSAPETGPKPPGEQGVVERGVIGLNTGAVGTAPFPRCFLREQIAALGYDDLVRCTLEAGALVLNGPTVDRLGGRPRLLWGGPVSSCAPCVTNLPSGGAPATASPSAGRPVVLL
jgi:hypothetical protein